jgi:hypothetical protein
MRRIGERRYLNLIEWAQNDNVGVSGRPATPPENFASSLTDRCGASAFGVIHWNWRPLDLYFKNLQRAVWKSSADELLPATIDYMALDLAGAQAPVLAEYLKRWMAEVPPFGCESAPQFDLGKLWGNNQEVARHSRERSDILANVQLASLRQDQKDQLQFFAKHEQWLRQMFEDNAIAYGTNKTEGQKVDAQRTVQYFADAIRQGSTDPGEKGLLVNLNLKWLTYRFGERQQLGKEAFRVKFQPTRHDPLAQCYSRFTFTFDEHHQPWAGLGQKETGYEVCSESRWGERTGDELLGAAWIQAKNVLKVSIGDLHGKATIPQTSGRVALIFPASESQQKLRVSIEGREMPLVTLPSGKAVYRQIFPAIPVMDGRLDITLEAPGDLVRLGAVEYLQEKAVSAATAPPDH